jgi:glycosyltransferase involved in cell wall biosynthesis
MRITLVSHTALYWTGLYARYFIAQGHDVQVISFSRNPLDGVAVEHVGSGTPSELKVPAYLARVPRVWSLLRSFAPDVVLATYVSSNGLVAALSRGRPLVISAHGSDVLGTPGGAWLHARMMRFVCRRAEIVHAVSQPIADVLVSCGAPADRIRCFPIGIDTDVFQAPTEPRPPGRPPRLICTRRHEALYGNETIVAALGALKRDGIGFQVALVGGGVLLEERRAQVKMLGLEPQVSLPGQLPLDGVRRALQESDVYVSASSRDGASSSLLEAMACGLFPVVSAIPANRAWVEDGATGLLFEPGDADGLAKALRRAILDADLRAAARERNRVRVVQDGNLAVNLGRMESLLEEAAR